MRGLLTVAAYGLQEALRRRIFHVVLLLTLLYLGLYWLGATTAFDEVRKSQGTLPLDDEELTGGTLFGLSMFGTLFLGAVLAAFLTLGVVRGDAERGLLQPLVVRPIGRTTLLLGRFLGAAAICVPYVLAVYAICAAITHSASFRGWWPDQFLRPGLQLALGVLVIAVLALLGSIFLSATANGIAIFMVFGAGLVAGLLGQIGEALNSPTLESVATRSSWGLPFEALYQDALHRITSDSSGLTSLAIQLGPFGGSQEAGGKFPLWVGAYFALALLVAVAAFRRKDL